MKRMPLVDDSDTCMGHWVYIVSRSSQGVTARAGPLEHVS